MGSPQASLPEWYPAAVPVDFSTTPLSESIYGPPNETTLERFKDLPLGSIIGDVACGDGRYTLALAEQGHHVLGLDIDTAHLDRLIERSTLLPPGAGQITPVRADLTQGVPLHEVDAAFTTGFIYLAPPSTVRELFAGMSAGVRPGGRVVVEFATDRVRRTLDDRHSLMGPDERAYSLAEGIGLLRGLFDPKEFSSTTFETVRVDIATTYRLGANVIIASGTRRP